MQTQNKRFWNNLYLKSLRLKLWKIKKKLSRVPLLCSVVYQIQKILKEKSSLKLYPPYCLITKKLERSLKWYSYFIKLKTSKNWKSCHSKSRKGVSAINSYMIRSLIISHWPNCFWLHPMHKKWLSHWMMQKKWMRENC